ncbi:MAG: helix-turn-helix transcriptional regulator [Clostridia bacterium]|nr:helix-turn-helix transcriptional regulator [Clostridia bacterium]
MKYTRIKDLREDLDKTQAEFAKSIGLYTTTYQRYERGERMIPFDIVVTIAKTYNISLDYLAGLIPTPKKLY